MLQSDCNGFAKGFLRTGIRYRLSLSLSDEKLGIAKDAFYYPAVKTAADRAALRQAVCDGTIDVVATDHAPHLMAEKCEKNIKIPSGMPLAQFSLIAMLELVHQGVFTLPQVVRAMCHAPADLHGIYRRGYLRPGYHADLVQVHPVDEGWTVTDGDVLSPCGWTPLAGAVMHHRVVRTWVNGRCAYKGGAVVEGIQGNRLVFKR